MQITQNRVCYAVRSEYTSYVPLRESITLYLSRIPAAIHSSSKQLRSIDAPRVRKKVIIVCISPIQKTRWSKCETFLNTVYTYLILLVNVLF